MHPRRWYWLLAQVDSQGRPLVVPNDVAFNPMATDAGVANVQGSVGRFLGLPVVLDPNIATNLGAGTNQDEVFLIKADDLWLFESTPRAEAFTAPYAESLGVLFRLYNYAGTILNRLSSSIATMNGTGLVAPTF
jgi:HK97 family phage major capsid protein